MNKIGGSSGVRDELTAALAEGRGVTAKVHWLSKIDEDGRNRWIHCTPLLGSNGQIGVWMIIIIDDDQDLSRRWKQAPPVGPHRGKVYGRDDGDRLGIIDGYASGSAGSIRNGYTPRMHSGSRNGVSGSVRSSSPNSVRL
jgi:hypothetical protein